MRRNPARSASIPTAIALLFAAACYTSAPPAPSTTTPPPPPVQEPAPDPVPPPAPAGAKAGEACGAADACGEGACVAYRGIAGARGPEFKTCEIRCADDGTCPAGKTCRTIMDGPGKVCR